MITFFQSPDWFRILLVRWFLLRHMIAWKVERLRQTSVQLTRKTMFLSAEPWVYAVAVTLWGQWLINNENQQKSIFRSYKIETYLNKRLFFLIRKRVFGLIGFRYRIKCGAKVSRFSKMSFFNLRFEKENFGFCSRLNPTPKWRYPL